MTTGKVASAAPTVWRADDTDAATGGVIAECAAAAEVDPVAAETFGRAEAAETSRTGGQAGDEVTPTSAGAHTGGSSTVGAAAVVLAPRMMAKIGVLRLDMAGRWIAHGLEDLHMPHVPRVPHDVPVQVRLSLAVTVRYLRSGWFLAEVMSIAAVFLLCFRVPTDVASFYSIAGLVLSLFAIVGTYALNHEVVGPRSYMRHSVAAVRRLTIAPMVLAAVITRIVAFAMLLTLVLLFGRVTPIEPGALAVGAVGLLANCSLVAAIVAASSAPFARRGTQVVVLAWLVLALATYSPDTMLSSLPVVPWVLRLPILPFAACYNMGVTGVIGWTGLVALLAEAAMIVAIVVLVDTWLRRREDRIQTPMARPIGF